MAAESIEMRSSPEVAEEVEVSAEPIPKEEYPTGLRFVLITVGLVLSIFLAALDSSIISTAIPKITDHFGAVQDVGWYGSAYAITNAAFQSCWGKAVSLTHARPCFLDMI
jgi:hypothetical protein